MYKKNLGITIVDFMMIMAIIALLAIIILVNIFGEKKKTSNAYNTKYSKFMIGNTGLLKYSS